MKTKLIAVASTGLAALLLGSYFFVPTGSTQAQTGVDTTPRLSINGGPAPTSPGQAPGTTGIPTTLNPGAAGRPTPPVSPAPPGAPPAALTNSAPPPGTPPQSSNSLPSSAAAGAGSMGAGSPGAASATNALNAPPAPALPPAQPQNAPSQPIQQPVGPVPTTVSQPATPPSPVAAPNASPRAPGTVVPVPGIDTLEEMTRLTAQVQVAKAKEDLLKVQASIKDLENKINPPANPLEQLMAAGLIPPNGVTRPPVQGAAVPAGPPVISPQQLQASLPAMIQQRTEQPPKLLTIRGQDNRLEAVFENSDDSSSQIIVKIGNELPGKWKVRDITYSSVGIAQAGKTESLMLKPGDFLPTRYSEPKGKTAAPAGAKPISLTPATKNNAPAARTNSAPDKKPAKTTEKKSPAKAAPKPSSSDDDDSRNG